MANEKVVQCYSLAKSIEKIDCALQDLKTTIRPHEMRSFNGAGMVLYSLQLEAKKIGNALPDMKPAANKIASRAKQLHDIVTAISVKPVPKVVSEFIQEDLGMFWEYQRALMLSAEKACLRPEAEAIELPKEKFRPIPADVKKAVAKVRKDFDREIAQRDRKWAKKLAKYGVRRKKKK